MLQSWPKGVLPNGKKIATNYYSNAWTNTHIGLPIRRMDTPTTVYLRKLNLMLAFSRTLPLTLVSENRKWLISDNTGSKVPAY